VMTSSASASGKVGQIDEKSNRSRTEIILHIVLKFQVDCTCLEGGEESANFGGKSK